MGKITNWANGDPLLDTEMNDVARTIFSQKGCPLAGSYTVSGLSLADDKIYTVYCIGAPNAKGMYMKFDENAGSSAYSATDGATWGYAKSKGSMVLCPPADGTWYNSNVRVDITEGNSQTSYHGIGEATGASDVSIMVVGGVATNLANMGSITFIEGSPIRGGIGAFSVYIFKNKDIIS